MARIVSIDYGLKRTGLAVTDPEGLIATRLGSLPTDGVLHFLKTYLSTESVECLVMGLPKSLSGGQTDATSPAIHFSRILCQTFDLPFHWVDERLTSTEARRSIVVSGLLKKKRARKSLVDEMAAVLILQTYLSIRS